MNHLEKVASAKVMAALGGLGGGAIGATADEDPGRNALIMALMGAGALGGGTALGRLGAKGGGKAGDALAELVGKGAGKNFRRGEETTFELARRLLKGDVGNSGQRADVFTHTDILGDTNKLRQQLAGGGMLGAQGGGRLAGGAAGVLGGTVGGAGAGVAGGLTLDKLIASLEGSHEGLPLADEGGLEEA